jgi:hypothetical protein
LSNEVNKAEGNGSAVGVWHEDRSKGPFRAVMLRKQGGKWELLWKKTSDGDRLDWEEFLVELSSARPSEVAVAFDSRAVGFHRINIPPVGTEQLEAIVKMQAEALLPLPLEEMRLGWRAGEITESGRTCTIAAARRAGLEEYVLSARACNVSRIYLDGEAVVKVWRELFRGTDKKSVLIRIGLNKTIVVLAEGGRLAHGAVLDVGQKDLSKLAGGQTSDLFVHDVQNVLEMFGVNAHEKVKVFVLSPDAMSHGDLVSHLKDSGIPAALAMPSGSLLSESSQVRAADIYENLEAVGAAMMALDSSGGVIELFDDLRVRSEPDGESAPIKVLKRASLLTLVMLIVFLAVSYVVDKASLAKIGSDQVTVLIEQRKLKELVARQRPDVVNLLTMISDSLPEGMIVDSFEFEKGRPVTLSSNGPNYEKVYEFQKALENQKNITDVEVQKAVFDEKKKQVSFKMALHYGRFTRK